MLDTISTHPCNVARIEEEVVFTYASLKTKQTHCKEMKEKGYRVKNTQIVITVTYRHAITLEILEFVYTSQRERLEHGIKMDEKGYLFENYASELIVTYSKIALL